MRAASNAPRKRRLRIRSRRSAISMPQPATCISIGSTKLPRRSSALRTGRYRGPISSLAFSPRVPQRGRRSHGTGVCAGPGTTSEPEVTHFKALALARSGQLERAGRFRGARSICPRRPASVSVRRCFKRRRPCGTRSWATSRRLVVTAALALDLSTGRDVSYAAAFALALTGDLSRSQALLKDLESRFPQDTTVNISYLPVLRGLIALQQGKLAEASRSSSPLCRTNSRCPARHSSPALEACIRPTCAARRIWPQKAGGRSRRFRKIISHRGLVMEDPSTRSRACNWPERSSPAATRRAPAWPTRTSSRCGKTRNRHPDLHAARARTHELPTPDL